MVKNPPAFPNDPVKALKPEYQGMTLRDWFAGQALKWAGHGEWFSDKPEHVAERAYKMADAMLAAREEGKDNGN